MRDLERSAAFYEQRLGLSRVQAAPPHAVVFDTRPTAFAVREPLPGTDLGSISRPGLGIALWLHTTKAQELHDSLAAGEVPITSAPAQGPFGLTFTFADPDGYLITMHDRA